MNGKNYNWEQKPHTADLAVAINARDHEGLIRAALEGLLGLLDLNSDPGPQNLTEAHHLMLNNPTIEDVLVDFLNDCIFLMEVDELVPVKFVYLNVKDGNLDTVMTCRKVRDRERNKIGHIKAATYSDLEVKYVDGNYSATLIFDT